MLRGGPSTISERRVSDRASALAAVLAASGVRAVFGVTGSGFSLQLITALESLGVRSVAPCHEGAGAIMAGSFGVVSGTLGCCVSIKGPGLANLLPGMLSNWYEGWPVLSVSEAYGPNRGGRAHKFLDHAQTVRACTKAYGELGDPTAVVPDFVRCARDEAPGPVHLDASGTDTPRIEWRPTVEAPTGDPARATHAIRDATRPVVIAGSLCVRRGWAARLSVLRLPVFTTVAAKGLIDERSAWSAGVYTGDGLACSPEARLLPEADLVVGIGMRPLEILTPRVFPAPLLLFDTVDPGTTDAYGATLSSCDDEGLVEEVIDGLTAHEWGREHVEEAAVKLRDRLTSDAWLPGAIFECLQRLVPTARLVVDTGLFCTVAEHVWKAATPGDFLASANGRFMGTSVPMAIGAALADPTRPVLCAVGDGGLRVAVGEIKLALEARLPIAFVLLTDGRYGSVAGVAAARGLSTAATTIPQPSWYQAMAALGCESERVDTLAALEAVFAAWRAGGGPLFVEAPFDPARYARQTEGVR